MISRGVCGFCWRLRMAVALAGVLLLCGAGWATTKAIVTESGDVLLKDSRSGKTTKFAAIPDACRSHYHAAEYNAGCVYAIRRFGPDDSDAAGNPKYKDELWRYDKNGHRRKLWSRGWGLDFRVSPDGEFIAVVASSQMKVYRSELYMLDRSGKLLKTFKRAGIVQGDFEFERWDGQCLWMKDQEEMGIYGFIRIDSRTLRLTQYAADLDDQDYALNTKSMLLAYSDYPVTFDSYDADEYKKSKGKVSLYVYDLRTQRNRAIARSITELFDPKWVGPRTLEYDNPRGSGRLRHKV